MPTISCHIIMNPATKSSVFSSSGHKRKPCHKDSRRRPWASLIPDLLIQVLMQLSYVDFLACISVCKEWRSIGIQRRTSLLQNQQPLAVLKSKFAKKRCFLENIVNETRYKILLPGLISKWLLGVSCGYLIMLDLNTRMLLVNLFTRHEICFPRMLVRGSFEPRAILFYSEEILDSLVLVISRKSGDVLLSPSSIPKWHKVVPVGSNEMPLDIAFFQGCIYVLTSYAKIGKLRLQYQTVHVTKFTTLRPDGQSLNYSSVRINNSGFLLSPRFLVASKDHLLMVSFVQKTEDRVIKVHKLDERLMEWIEVFDLGEDALFLSEGSCAVVNPTKWGGCSNCIYILPKLRNELFVYHFNVYQYRWTGRVIQEGGSLLQPHFWYFPHQIDDMNILRCQEEAGHS